MREVVDIVSNWVTGPRAQAWDQLWRTILADSISQEHFDGDSDDEQIPMGGSDKPDDERSVACDAV